MVIASIDSQLLGPPELQLEVPSLNLLPEVSDVSSTNNKDNATYSNQALMGLTENSSPTFLSTGNPCLDFFFHILPDTPKYSLLQRLNLAWKHNPLTTLKLICHLRGVRGTGKSDKEGFYAAALWLHAYHPNTLALNVRWFAEFGYLKDLLEILYRILEGLDVRSKAKIERGSSALYWVRGKRHQRKKNVVVWRKGRRVLQQKSLFKIRRASKLKPRKEKKSVMTRQPVLYDWISAKMSSLNSRPKRNRKIEQTKPDEKSVEIEPEEKLVKVEQKKTAKFLRQKKNLDMARKALRMYASDPKYRFLHDKISDHFAELLRSDIEYLKNKEFKKISLASKWCPSLDSSYDRSTLICESIARKVFPRDSDPDYKDIEDAHYAYRVRDRLRKEVLVPLHRALHLPEIYMTAKKWHALPYNRVSSVAMTIYKKLFREHDSTRFFQYLENVRKGEAKIAASALLPHEILQNVYGGHESEVAELQWNRMVEDLSVQGKMKNCLAVCDVSGSMDGIPMQVCIALGMLLSELCEKPWKGKVITFSRNPTLQTIKGDTLAEKKCFVSNMEWGMSTDFQKVFDLILQVAVNGNLRKSKMIKRLFVFSDMEFDQASANSWETDYQAIQRKFCQKGYGSAIPEIVFWNLRNSKATPVDSTQKGVALVSGYSKNLLKLFLDGDGDALNPEVIMEKAISGAEYKNLHVFD